MRCVICGVTLWALGCAGSGSGLNEGPRPVGSTGTVTSAYSSGNSGGGVSHPLYSSSDLGIEITLPVPVDSAYTAMERGYFNLGIDLKTRDDASHTIGNKKLIVMRQMLGHRASDLFDCGLDPTIGVQRADRYRLTVSVISTLSAAGPGRTVVTTKAYAEAEDLATSATPVYCSSTGLMERTLVQAAGLQPS
jgi:hypothetical protein